MAHTDRISAALARVRAPLFLAQVAERDGRMTVSLHTTDRVTATLLRRQAVAEFGRDGINAKCRLIVHRSTALRRKRSIESLSRSFGNGGVVYDPTGIAGRSELVLACAAMLRARTQFPVSGIYLQSWRRTLYVILDRSAFPQDAKELLAKRVDALREITGAIGAWRAERCPDFDLAIRIGFELPAGLDLIAVDHASASRSLRSRLTGIKRRSGLAAALASMLGLGVATQATAADISIAPSDPYAPAPSGSEPAVAAPILGVTLLGAWIDGGGFSDDAFGGAQIKGSVPLGHSFGAQLDAAIGTDGYYGVGGHLFWRDPNAGLLGVFAVYEDSDGGDLARYGAEGEAYLGNFTLRGVVGGMDGDRASGDFFAGADVAFYATPNLKLSAGGEYSEDFSFGKVGVEWQPAMDAIPGMSVFADGEFGESDYTRVMAGVNFHFGTNGASLLDRDRRFDPPPLTTSTRGVGKDAKGYKKP